MNICKLCPRECKIDCGIGYCTQEDARRAGLVRVAGAYLHKWEEPCLSWKNGSGTVFFCGCTLSCVYCQNSALSKDCKIGELITPEDLSKVFLRLWNEGAHNINLVTPTMYSKEILKSITLARSLGLALPVVYNTSGYERVDALENISDNIDVYLPDFKYLSSEIAERYSNAADYPENAKASLKYMVDKLGTAEFSDDGIMNKGVIVRHLLLPGLVDESKRVLEYLFAEYGNDIYYSIMSQYTPVPSLDKEKYPELDRRVTTYEYNKLVDYALSLGIKNGFIQSGSSAKESFVPDFEKMRVL